MAPDKYMAALRQLVKETPYGDVLDWTRARELNGGSSTNLSTRLHAIAAADKTMVLESKPRWPRGRWRVVGVCARARGMPFWESDAVPNPEPGSAFDAAGAIQALSGALSHGVWRSGALRARVVCTVWGTHALASQLSWTRTAPTPSRAAPSSR